jgi:carbon-monoxide dehydrogenase medium subunit
MISVKQYFLPKSVNEAVQFLKEGNGKYYPIGGGTGFAFSKPRGIDAIVDLSRTGLHYVRELQNGLHVGAMTPIQDLVKKPVFSQYFGGIVHEAGLAVATTPLRNLITVGGNVMQVYLWSNLPPLLLAVGAKFKTVGMKKRTINADQFFSSQPRRQMGSGTLLKEIVLPENDRGVTGAFLKFSKTETDLAMMNIAVALWMKKGICRKVRIAVGAIAPMPVRLKEVERLLKGNSLTKDIIKNASYNGTQSLNILKDFRVRDGYKKEVLPVLLSRCLLKAVGRID